MDLVSCRRNKNNHLDNKESSKDVKSDFNIDAKEEKTLENKFESIKNYIQVPVVLHNKIEIIKVNDSCFKDFVILSVLGKGTYAQVWKVKDRQSGCIYAAKLLQPSQFPKESFNRIIEMFTKEIINLAICQCPGVIKLHKVIGGEEGWLLIQDYADDGTLWKENLTSNITQSFLYFIQLLQGMMFIQDMNIVHRDLKPTNVLKFQNNRVVIADFGWSEHVDSCNLHPSEWPGTLEINPPEVLRNCGPMGEKIDNYALGMNMILFISGRFVCRQKGVECSKVASTILKTVHNLRHSKPPSKFKENLKAWDLFLKLTNSNPLERYSLDDVLFHPWVTEMFTNLSIHYSKFIWHERVKRRWVNVMSVGWNLTKGVSTPFSHINNYNMKNVSNTTTKELKDTKSIKIKTDSLKQKVNPIQNKHHYEVVFNLMKNSFKNKFNCCSVKKNESTQNKEKQAHKLELTKEEKNNAMNVHKNLDLLENGNRHEIINQKKQKEILEKMVHKVEQTASDAEEKNKEEEEEEEKQEEEQEEEEEEEQEEEEQEDEEEEEEEQEEDEEEEEEEEEKEEEEEDSSSSNEEDDENMHKGDMKRKQRISNILCKDREEGSEIKNMLMMMEKKREIQNYTHELVQSNISLNKGNKSENKIKCTNEKEMFAIRKNEKERYEENNGLDQLDRTFLSLTESKNLYIPKDLINNELLERISKLGEEKKEESNHELRKNDQKGLTNEKFKNCENNIIVEKKDNPLQVTMCLDNSKWIKNKLQRNALDSKHKYKSRNDSPPFVNNPVNKNIRNIEEHENMDTSYTYQRKTQQRNEKEINRNSLSKMRDLSKDELKNCIDKLDKSLHEQIQKIENKKKEPSRQTLFSQDKTKLYVVEETTENALDVEKKKETQNCSKNNSVNETESSEDAYENIIEKCLKKTGKQLKIPYFKKETDFIPHVNNHSVFSISNTTNHTNMNHNSNRNSESKENLVNKIYKDRRDLLEIPLYGNIYNETHGSEEKKFVGKTMNLDNYLSVQLNNMNNISMERLKISAQGKESELSKTLLHNNKNKEDTKIHISTDVEREMKKYEEPSSNMRSSSNSSYSYHPKDHLENNKLTDSKFLKMKEGLTNRNSKINFDKYIQEMQEKQVNKKNTKTLMELSNEYNKSYYTHSKISSSTLNSNISSDINNSIIENFVNNTRGNNHDSLKSYLKEMIKGDTTTFEDFNNNTRICSSSASNKKEIQNKNQPKIVPQYYKLEESERKKQMDFSNNAKERYNNQYNTHNSMASIKVDSGNLLQSLIKDFDLICKTYERGNSIEEGDVPNDYEKIANHGAVGGVTGVERHILKFNDMDKYQMKLNSFTDKNVSLPSMIHKDKTDNPFNIYLKEKTETEILGEWNNEPMETKENEEGNQKKILDTLSKENATSYQKILTNYKTGLKRGETFRNEEFQRENKNSDNIKTQIHHYVHKNPNTHFNISVPNNMNNENVNINENINTNTNLNSRITVNNKTNYKNQANRTNILGNTLNNYKNSSTYLGEYLKENFSKTSSSSTFYCSDLDFQNSSGNNKPNSLNTQSKFTTIEKEMYQRKKNFNDKGIFN